MEFGLVFTSLAGALMDIGDLRFPMLFGKLGGYREWSPMECAVDCRVCTRPPLLASTALCSTAACADQGQFRDFEVRTRELPSVELYEVVTDCRRHEAPF